MNEVLQAIRKRRSVRKFTGEAVPESTLRAVLDAGRWAPSGLNNQPWKFVVITDQTTRAAVAAKTKYRKVLEQAPLQIAIFLDQILSYDRTKDVQGIGACMQNMLLAAHSLGLGTVWMGEILNRREEVEGLLAVPESFELMGVIAVGHPFRKPADSERRALEELIFKRY